MSENATPRTAKQQFDDALEDDKIPPLERLRFFCSLAFKEPQDWLDVEPFFDDIERELSAANARIAELEKDAARYLDAVFAMADDGWLMYGEEGMSLVQEEVYKIAKEHPEYKRRAAADAKP